MNRETATDRWDLPHLIVPLPQLPPRQTAMQPDRCSCGRPFTDPLHSIVLPSPEQAYAKSSLHQELGT